MLPIRVAVSLASSLVLLTTVTHARAQDAEPTPPLVESPDWRTLDPELAKAVDEFDLDAHIDSLAPPTMDDVLRSLGPVPSIDDVIKLVRDPIRRPEIPSLPHAVAQRISNTEMRIEEIRKLVLAPLAVGDREAAIAEALALAERVVAVREEYQGGDRWRNRRGEPVAWHELADAEQTVSLLRLLKVSSPAQRQAAAVTSQLLELGDAAHARGDLASAETHCRDGLAIWLCTFPGDHPFVALGFNDFAKVFESRGNIDRAQSLYLEALAMCQRLHGDDVPEVATQANNLALAVEAQGDPATAESLLCLSLQTFRRLFLGDHSLIATSLSNIASFFKRQRDWDTSELACREALAMLQRLHSEDHPQVAQELNSLASILESRGDLRNAEKYYRDSLAMCRRLFPGDHKDVAKCLNNLASALEARGELAEAESLFRQALAMRRRLFPGDHRLVAHGINNLASVLWHRGDLANAESHVREALAMYERLYPDGNTYVAMGRNNLAAILQARGDLAGAELFFGNALETLKSLFPTDHPYVAGCLTNLAGVMNDRGDFAGAQPLYFDALAMYQRLYPTDHPRVATCLNNLAGALEARGDLEQAEVRFRDALAMYQRLFPGDHPDVATCLNNLAFVLDARGDLKGAEAIYEGALAMRERLFSGDHPDVAEGLNNLASIMKVSRDLVRAEHLYRDSLAMRRRLFTSDHPDLLQSINNLGSTLHARGKIADAKSLAREGVAMSRRLFSGDHQYKAGSLLNLAAALHVDGNLEEAELIYRECLAMYTRFFVGDHTDIAAASAALAAVLEDRGDLPGAEQSSLVALSMSERLRTKIVGDEQERAAFADKLQLAERSASYAGVLARLDRGAESLSVLERGRSRSVLDLLERRDRDVVAEAKAAGDETGSSKLDAAVAAEDQSRIDLNSTEALLGGRTRERQALANRTDLEESTKTKRLADYDREIAELGKKVESQRQTLAQAGGAVLTELRGLFPSAKPLTTEEILSRLNPEELVLSLAWSDDAQLTATAGRNGGAGMTTGHVTVDGKEAMTGLNAQATMIREAIATRPASSDSADLRSAASALLSALIPEQIRASVETAKRLVVIPDGPMHGIPIEALVALAGDDSIAGLLADKHIVYAPSATMYLDRRQVARQQTGPEELSVVVLGDPIFDRKPLPEPDYPQEGVLLAMVAPESNASKAGLSRGDVLLSYEGTKLPNSEALGPAVASANEAVESGEREAGKPVKISFWRDGKTQETTLSPGRMGVQPSGGSPADGLRAMARAERGYEQAAAGISATDQVRLHGGRLAPLPGTKREATAIAKTISGAGGHVLTLLGEQATIGKLSSTAPGKRIIHLATHGLTGSRDRPYDASLALTQPVEPTPDDVGFLTLDELMGSWLGRLKGCELVVLSACDTGRGVRKGDSVMALPIGFFAAGAPTVIASLWQVNDLSTSILMEDFYANLIEKKMPKASALDEAKRSLRAMTWEELKRRALMTEAELEAYTESRGLGKTVTAAKGKLQGPFAHPYYWAPFVLIGDPE